MIVKLKWSRYRPGVAQKVGRGIALLFHDRGTRRRWVVSSTPRPHFTPGKDPVPIVQEARWAPGPVWSGGKSRPLRNSIPDRPARSQSLYRLSYRAYLTIVVALIHHTNYRKACSRLFVSHASNSPPPLQITGSSPYSQEPAVFSYPEPD